MMSSMDWGSPSMAPHTLLPIIVIKGLKPIEFNIEKAKSLLAQAGWTDSDNNGYVDKDINGVRTELKIKYLMNASRLQKFGVVVAG